jgi:hypothetical protein
MNNFGRFGKLLLHRNKTLASQRRLFPSEPSAFLAANHGPILGLAQAFSRLLRNPSGAMPFD